MIAAPDLSTLSELRSKGLRLEPLPGGRINVVPRERLTPELRARILERKPALLAALEAERKNAAELQRRIRAMAVRWGYSPNELAEALAGAATNPASWAAWVEHDERHFGACQTPADFAAAYRRLYNLCA